jgi:uncharacterized membrane protein
VAKNAARDAAKKSAKANTARDAAAKKPVKEAAKKAVRNTAKELVTKPAKDTAKKPAKKPAKETVKKPAKETSKETVTEAGNNIANNEAADPVDEGLRLIQSKPEGILQSELWKELGVDSRKCSRIVKKLEESGLIERVDFKREGIKTYLLRAKQQPVNPSDLLAGDELIPCIGCELECVVEECHPLMDWMYQLAIVEHTEE